MSDGPQALDDLARLIEPTRMRVAGGEIAVGVREAWIFWESDELLCHVETPGNEMCAADDKLGGADARTQAETKRGLAMLDRDVGQACPIMEGPADMPPTGETRVQLQRAIDQRDHRTDVLAEICERERGIRQDARVVPCHFQSPPG